MQFKKRSETVIQLDAIKGQIPECKQTLAEVGGCL